jgi:integrase
MKGHVYKRGKSWSYMFDIDPDPLTGKRRQANGSGYKTEAEAWRACRTAMKEYEDGQRVKPSKRTVEQALNEWLKRIKHAVKPSMWQNWRNYADHYVILYIGERKAQDIDGAVLDALYGKLLTEGRVKARKKAKEAESKPKRKRKNAKPKPPPKPLPPGLAPKTVINTHRMLHRAWVDFEAWRWVHRNVVKDAHAPSLPRAVRKVWTAAQLRTFLEVARKDRFYALWVLEATSGFRRCELAGARRDGLDFEAATLTIEVTRVVVDGKVVISDGKSENAQRTIALDPFHSGRAQGACRDARPGEQGVRAGLSRWRLAVLLGERHASAPGHDHAAFQASRGVGRAARHRPARRSPLLRDGGTRREDRLESAEQPDRPRRRGVHDEAVRTGRP